MSTPYSGFINHTFQDSLVIFIVVDKVQDLNLAMGASRVWAGWGVSHPKKTLYIFSI